MPFGLNDHTIFAAVVAWAIVFLFARRFLPGNLAALVAIIKAAIPLVYFAYFYTGLWTFSDDRWYLYVGQNLVGRGYNPLSVFLSAKGFATLVSLSHGSHFLYGWWNLLAVWLLGQYYYAPVFLNVGLTGIAAYFLYRSARLAGFSRLYGQCLAVFFMFHWDVLSWSSLTNLKDTGVLMLTTAIVYNMLELGLGGHTTKGVIRTCAGLFLWLFLMVWLRSYVAMVLLGAFLLWALITTKGRQRTIISTIGVVMAAYLFTRMPGLTPKVLAFVNPSEALFGMLRFMLTPQPWSLDTKYGFLIIPATLHWIHFVPSIVGAYYLWRQGSATKLVIVYIVIASVLYGAIDVLQGPRHRVQLSFIWAWVQFHIVYLFAKATAGSATSPCADAGASV